MPAVINVGGPLTWGLVVLVSAWAVRAVKALARRHHAGRKRQDDELLLHGANARQPQYLQRLSATAIRMLIETGALPCAVLELADGGAGGGASCRIVPTELTTVVPCMLVAAWVRAMTKADIWNSELASAAGAAAGAAGTGDGGGGGTLAAGTVGGVRVSNHERSNLSREVEQKMGAETAQLRHHQQQQRLQRPQQLYAGSDPRVAAQAAAAGVIRDRDTVGGAVLETARISGAAVAASSPIPPYPSRNALLAVLGRSERAVAAVTAAAARAGFSRVGVWVGPADSFAAASLEGPRLPPISRHALWLMLQLGHEPLFHVPSLVLDVRRPDERMLYGAIRGTINIPADELAAALALPAEEFRRRFGVPRPGPSAAVVVHSRSGRRAAWAAQVCLDEGLRRVFVYGEGVNGWRFEERVKPYRSYELGAPPPDPEPFTAEEPDEALGLEELHALGLPMRQGPRPSRFELLPVGDPISGAGDFGGQPALVAEAPLAGATVAATAASPARWAAVAGA